MKLPRIGSGLLLFTIAFLQSTLLFAQTPAQNASPASWSGDMKKLRDVLQELMIDLSSDERFNNKSNFKKIEKNASKISELAHGLEAKVASAPDKDISVAIIGSQFAKEADHAYRTLLWGHREYARGVLQSLTGYCIACHTRSNVGPSFTDTPKEFQSTIKKLSDLDRGQYFAASRQFDLALDSFEAMVSDEQIALKRPFDWEKALRNALAIAVRVKKEPARAASIVDKVLGIKKTPHYIQEQAKEWKKSIARWREEAKSSPKTEEGYYALAVKLTADAKSQQKFPADRSADILYLRASSAIHDLLSLYPQGKRSADAFYLAGLTYEVLSSTPIWDMQEYYYLACIYQAPNTGRSRQCYRRYEENIYQGYTGSSGTQLPEEIRDKLKFLDQLSDPDSNKKSVLE